MGHELEQGTRLISAGGNLYAAYLGPVTTGDKTRGRGFWAGRSEGDEVDPDIDNPSVGTAQVLIPREGENDGFDDDKPPHFVVYPSQRSIAIEKLAAKQSKELAEAIWGTDWGRQARKSLLTLGSVKVDILMTEPRLMTEEALIKSATQIKRMLADKSLLPSEVQALREQAHYVAKSLRGLLDAKRSLAHAIRKANEEDDDAPVKKTKQPKSGEQKADARGKTQYKYPRDSMPASKNHRPVKGDQQDEGDEAPTSTLGPDSDAAEPTITRPPPLDPEHFAKLIGVPVEKLTALAEHKDRETFQKFFMRSKKLVEKHNLTNLFFGRLWDTLTGADAQDQGDDQEKPEVAAKSLVVINPDKLNGDAGLLDLIKGDRADTIGDLYRQLVDAHGEAVAMTTLRKWQLSGVITLHRES